MTCASAAGVAALGEFMVQQLPPLAELFSPDYITARRRFRDRASRLQWESKAIPIGLYAGVGQPLTIDLASTPNSGASKLLVLSSGVHGVEGFFGSAVQLALIELWEQCGHPDVRCLLIHAVNPFGFQRGRRTNENNVDLNRNFLLEGEVFQGAPVGYAELDAILNPATPITQRDLFTVRVVPLLLRKGFAALKQSIAGGQYEFPEGVFFGGSKHERSVQLLADHFPQWIDGIDEVVHLDFHTGLGRNGSWKLLLDYAPTSDQIERLDSWFGPASYEVNDPSGTAYDACGGFGRWCVSNAKSVDYLFACAEFGTFGPVSVLAGLRRENQLHHWGAERPELVRSARQRLAELFCPASPVWRRKVIDDSIQLVELSVNGLVS